MFVKALIVAILFNEFVACIDTIVQSGMFNWVKSQINPNVLELLS